MSACVNRRYEHSTVGHADLQPFIVSVKILHLSEFWPDADRKALASARAAYDAGTHEMCQGRAYSADHGPVIIQYLIPRRQPARPRKFFGGL